MHSVHHYTARTGSSAKTKNQGEAGVGSHLRGGGSGASVLAWLVAISKGALGRWICSS